MGIDLRCLAVPLDAEPVRALRADADLWMAAQEYPPLSTRPPRGQLPEISRALLAALPDGAAWTEHFPDRTFQQAEYLLDPAANRAITSWPQRERSLPYRIVHGDEPFAEHGRWRCSGTAFLLQSVRSVDDLDLDRARSEFSVADMDDEGVYKVSPDESDDDVFTRILGDLRAMADFYRATAARDLDLIIAAH